MVTYARQQAAAQRERVLEKQIKRFAKGYQRRLRKLVKTSSRLGDLLYSFPAAAFAVVSGHGDYLKRGKAIRLVKNGAGLKEVAVVLELPYWTRRLPPEAFTGEIGCLPDGVKCNRKIVNLIPADPEAAAMWLSWLQAARIGCDDDFALWLAGQKKIYVSASSGQMVRAPVLPLATFAWFSSHGNEPARRLMEDPWRRDMGIGTAIKSMASWFDRVLIDLTRADVRRGPGRYSKRKGNGWYNFVPLVTARDFYEEGEAMNHCVATYATAVAQGHCKIFSVRRHGRRVATLEIRWSRDWPAKPVINQLLGHSNMPVSRDVYLAVGDWLARDRHGLRTSNGLDLGDSLDETRWRSLWASYIAEKGDQAVVPARPDGKLIARFCRDVQVLNRWMYG